MRVGQLANLLDYLFVNVRLDLTLSVGANCAARIGRLFCTVRI